MLSSNYYRASAPGTWGTSGYRFGQPPEPHFRPQPSWGGLDYYQAHALDPDPMLYRDIREGRYDIEGAGLHEARHWHKQAYGGFADVRMMSARDIGHAAAYEAYRIWIHNRYIHDQRSDFGERREAFIALAIAEVSHVFPMGQMSHERRRYQEACETAAATASTIFHTVDDDSFSHHGSSVSSTSFHRAGSSSSDDMSDDLYAFDDRVMPHRSPHRHRRRNSSVSFNSHPMLIPPNTSPYHATSSMPIPVGQPTYNYGGTSPYHTGGSPYNGSSPYHGPSTFPQQYPGSIQGMPLVGSSYDPNQAYLYQGAASYPQQTYIQTQPGMSQTVPMPHGSTLVIQQPPQESSRHHKRRHKHRSKSRHRSHSDAGYMY